MRLEKKRRPRRPMAINRLEALEPRALMAGTVQANYGAPAAPHTLVVTLDNGDPSASPAQQLTMNAQQYLDGGNGAIFSGRIIGPTGQDFDDPTTHNGNAILHFFVNSGDTDFDITDFSPQMPSPEDPARNQVTYSDHAVPLVANLVNSVRINAERPLTQQRTDVFTNLRILVDTISPTVEQVGPIDSPRDTKVSTVTVTISEPVQLAEFTFQDLALTKDGKAVPLDATVTVADAGAPGRYTINGLGDFTDEAGTYVLTVNSIGLLDAVGNSGKADGARSATFTFDPDLNIPPAPPPPDLQAGSDSGFSQTDNITSSLSLTFDVGGVGAATPIRLLRGGNVVGSRVGPGPITVTTTAGVQVYTTQQVDANGIPGRQSIGLSVVVDVTPPVATVALDPTQITFSGDTDPLTATTASRPRLIVKATDLPVVPGRVLFAEIFAIDGRPPSVPTAAPPALGGDAIAPLTVPSDLAPGPHTVQVLVRDAAFNSVLATLNFTVLARPALATPGTPVYTTIYDINAIESVLDPGDQEDDNERPWSMSFDRTTQTVFAVVRGEDTSASNDGGGNRLIQLDPATGLLRAWNFESLDANSGPHGTFFDFESHLTPRIWFTQRTGDQSAHTHAGRLSYLDLTTSELVTYDIRQMLLDAGVTGRDGRAAVGDLHAVVSDRRGVVWVSDEADGLILELDLRGQPEGVNSRNGILVVHRVPLSAPPNTLSLIQGENVAGPHGLEVVVDDRDNTATVYYTSIIEGRFNALKPADTRNRAANDPARQVEDKWYSWDIDGLLRSELYGPDAKTGDVIGAPIFPTIDTNETPNRPEDDFVYFGDPGFPRETINGRLASNNVIRQLTPGDLRAGPVDVTSTVKTWHVPPATATGPTAQINQTFADRDGTVFFIDRQGSVGRIDPASAPGATVLGSTTFAAKAVFTLSVPRTLENPLAPIVRVVPSVATVLPRLANPGDARAGAADLSAIGGLDRYAVNTVTGALRPGQGNGPFRATFSAGSILYTSLTQGDQISSTLFAEQARRKTAVVLAPDGSRKVFQTLRDGRVVLTERDPGSVLDRQSVLTRAGVDPAIEGDVAAVVNAAGVIHAFGRDSTGGLAEYRFDPATKTWTARILGRAATNLAGDPQAYLDPARGAAALATTTDGHLVAFFADNGQVVDLTVLAGAGAGTLVHAKAAVVQSNGQIFAYATNQAGNVIEYVIGAGASSATARTVPLPAGNRDLMVFQDLEAVEIGGTRHVFGSDGAARLVHVTIRPDGTASAENVTERTKDLAKGYTAYQQPYAARVYGGANAVVTPDGEIFVYGTNGRDLVEFRRIASGEWSAENLTSRPANRVFGNPSAYVTDAGDRHVLLINEDGELIEYFKLAGLEFATANITLGQGNSTTEIPPTFPNTLPGSPQVPTADDHADLPGFAATALDLSTGAATIAGQIGTAGDRDVFRFVATRTGRLVLTVANGGDRDFRTVLVALSARKKRIAQSDGNARGRAETQLTIPVVEGRTYYLVAKGKTRRTGLYTISTRYRDVAIRSISTKGEKAIVTRFGHPRTFGS